MFPMGLSYYLRKNMGKQRAGLVIRFRGQIGNLKTSILVKFIHIVMIDATILELLLLTRLMTMWILELFGYMEQEMRLLWEPSNTNHMTLYLMA